MHLQWRFQTRYGCWRIPFIPFFHQKALQDLWKDSTKAAQAAKVMRLTAADLKEMGIVEKVFAEPNILSAETMKDVADELEKNIEGYLEEYTTKTSKNSWIPDMNASVGCKLDLKSISAKVVCKMQVSENSEGMQEQVDFFDKNVYNEKQVRMKEQCE